MGRPQKLDEFSAYYQQYVEVTAGREAIERQYSIVTSMYDMLQQYGGKVPPTDQVALDDAKEVVTTFTRSLAEACDFVDERKPAMINMLAKAQRDNNEQLACVVTSLRSGEFDQGDAVALAILVKLEVVQGQYDAVVARTERYRQYEELFAVQPSNTSAVDDVSNG